MGGGERTVIVCPVPSGLMINTTTMYIGHVMFLRFELTNK